MSGRAGPGGTPERYFAEHRELGLALTDEEWDDLCARHDQVMADPADLPGHEERC